MRWPDSLELGDGLDGLGAMYPDINQYCRLQMNQLLMAPFNCEASFFMGRYINHINQVTLGPMSSCQFWHSVSNYWYIHTCKSNSHSQLQWKYLK